MMPIKHSKPDLHNINAHAKFDENPLTFTEVIIQKWKCGRAADRQLSKILEIYPLAIQNQISKISMHTPSFVKIHWYLL